MEASLGLWCNTPHQCCHILIEILGITLARRYRPGVVDQAQLGFDTVQESVVLLLSLLKSLVQEEMCRKFLTIL